MLRSELDVMLENHAKWLKGLPDGEQANLSGFNLAGFDLSHIDLSKSIMIETDLTGANLSDSRFSEANMSMAVLTGATLSRADFRGTILTRADLNKAIAHHADFANADLSHCQMKAARCYYANFSKARMMDVKMQDSTFTDSTMCGTILRGAMLSESILTGCDMTDADLTCAALTSANLTNATLTRIILDGAELAHAEISDEELEKWAPSKCPAKGAFIGWMYASRPHEREKYIVKLEVPVPAQRCNPPGKLCRCRFATVRSIQSIDGKERRGVEVSVEDCRGYLTSVWIGSRIGSSHFTDDRKVKKLRAFGIPLFLNRDDAVRAAQSGGIYGRKFYD